MKFFRFFKPFDVSSEIQNAYNDYFKECGYKQSTPELPIQQITESQAEVSEPVNKTAPEESFHLLIPAA